MDAALRARFNAAFSARSYARYATRLEESAGTPIGFRLAETPLFLSEAFRERCERAARDIVAQLSDPVRIARMRAAIPAQYDVPGEGRLPHFAVVDFAVARDDAGELVPRLVELQGFPSLLAFEVLQLDAWSATLDEMGLGAAWTSWFGGRDRSAFLSLARDTIVGDADPATVALVDLRPLEQKTSVDFAATEKLFGVAPACVTELYARGRRVFRRDERGRELPVERIYWRVVIDELERAGVRLPFDLRDVDVAWVPHPNWFWTWSKFSLPFLDHPAVPRTRLLSELDALPAGLDSRYVLKPLFSFAGGGVNVAPTERDVGAIPASERGGWCLQEKIAYAGAFPAADDGGPVKAEIRTMFLRPDRAPALELATNLCRLARGAMLGVDFNKNMTFVGSSIGVWSGERA